MPKSCYRCLADLAGTLKTWSNRVTHVPRFFLCFILNQIRFRYILFVIAGISGSNEAETGQIVVVVAYEGPVVRCFNLTCRSTSAKRSTQFLICR